MYDCSCVSLLQMVSFFEKNSKERTRTPAGKGSAFSAMQSVMDSVPTSGSMSQQELTEV